MRIINIQDELIATLPYLNAGKGMGNFYVDQLPVHFGEVDQLPDGVSALVVTADLQGRETFESANRRPPRLLGEVLPAILESEILPTLDLPNGRIGTLLAGDFYTVPGLDKRGGSGNVTSVWEAFAETFDWVAGVAGNHDTFGSRGENPFKPKLSGRCQLFDRGTALIDDLQIAGLSGIIGNPRRAWRRAADDFVEQMVGLTDSAPDILIMHDGPDCPEFGFRGTPMIREALAMCEPTLIVRGHAHWDRPLVELDSGHQVLNVDARVVVLAEPAE